ncbi:MAG: glycosyltransferase [Acidobacteria bacterium]|nr:glycosyltransferase [Acidobacteriota bacterium]
MRFSVVIPTLNRPEHIRRSVRAALDQSHRDVEVIVCSKGSAGLEDLPDDPRLQILETDDRGVPHALNQGLAASTGDVLHYACDDDLMEPGALEWIAANLGDRRWLTGKTWLIDADDQVIGIKGGEPWSLAGMAKRNICMQPAVFWTRSALEAVGPMDESVGHVCDYDYWIRLGLRWEPLVTDQVLARYRVHPGSISVCRREEQDALADKVRQKHRAVWQ